MSTIAVTTSRKPGRDWTARLLAGAGVLFLLFDGVGKLANVVQVREAMAQLGYPEGTAPGIGGLLLACLALYLLPRTRVLGAILLTAFLGGAVASQLRVGNPLLTHVLFPVYVGTLLWVPLYLRDHRVRALLSSGG